MREIKFRAWDGERIYLPSTSLWDGEFTLIGGDIFMQFTGLFDKNGKEIYESDIIDSKYKWKVFFENGSYWLTNNSGKEVRDLYVTLKMRERAGCPMEVIGNIYENPELVKQKSILI